MSLCLCGCGQKPAKWNAEYVRGHRPPTDPVVHFWSKVERTETCWLWQGPVNSVGYGRYPHPITGKFVLAHRFALGLEQELIDGLEVDHLCRQRLCVRADHLEQVTRQENMRRARLHRQPITHCRHGHAYDDENTVINSRGYRECRACLRSRGRAA